MRTRMSVVVVVVWILVAFTSAQSDRGEIKIQVEFNPKAVSAYRLDQAIQ
jgi:hypothetical protein